MEGEEARAAAEEEDVDDGKLEAAVALAGLGCRSDAAEPIAASSSHPSQDPATATQQFRYTSYTVTTLGYQSNSVGKLKQISNEAEKEARKLRRIQANRESARQSIRRRQALYLELTRKAAYLSEENENLKKVNGVLLPICAWTHFCITINAEEMELTMVKYNSLKEREKILKAQMMKVKKAEQQEDTQGEPKKSTDPPLVLYNQPSLVPCFWPSSSSDVNPLRCASHPNPNVVVSSQFLVPDQGQENSMPVFLLPIPWMFPVLTNPNNMRPANDQSNEISPTQQCVVNTGSSTDTVPRHDNNNDVAINGVESADSVSAIEQATQSVSNNDTEPFIGPKKREEAFAATEARKKRKEFMKMKNIH